MIYHDSMVQIFTVSFFGHRYIDHFTAVEDRLEEWMVKLLREHDRVHFLVGRNGDFDQIVSSTIKKVKRRFHDDPCTQILVLPYPSAEFRNSQDAFAAYYDAIEICPESHAMHFKAAIQTRNRRMIDRSDLCVFYVERKSGGAFQSLQYAMKENKRVINIADMGSQGAIGFASG